MTVIPISSETSKQVTTQNNDTTKGNLITYNETKKIVDNSSTIRKKEDIENGIKLKHNEELKINQKEDSKSDNNKTITIMKVPTTNLKSTIVNNVTIDTINKTTQSNPISFCSLYLSQLKLLHPISSSFLKEKLNHLLISCFISIITSDFLFNSWYYSDRYISHTYHHGYSFWYDVDKAIPASASTFVIFILLKMILKYKVIYYIVAFVFHIFVWYCSSAFCSVYQHNQVHLIYSLLISLIFSFGIYPLLIALLCSILLMLNKKYTLLQRQQFIQINLLICISIHILFLYFVLNAKTAFLFLSLLMIVLKLFATLKALTLP